MGRVVKEVIRAHKGHLEPQDQTEPTELMGYKVQSVKKEKKVKLVKISI